MATAFKYRGSLLFGSVYILIIPVSQDETGFGNEYQITESFVVFPHHCLLLNNYKLKACINNYNSINLVCNVK